MKGILAASPGEDLFGNLYGTMTELGKLSSRRTIATPLSSPNADSPVVRTRRYVSEDNLMKSALNREIFKEQTIGLGLMEAFSLKQEAVDVEDDGEIDSTLMSSPVLRARSAAELDLEDRNEEGLVLSGLLPPVKKRRKTHNSDVV